MNDDHQLTPSGDPTDDPAPTPPSSSAAEVVPGDAAILRSGRPKREPKVTFARVLREFQAACDRRGLSAEQIAQFTPCFGLTRMSDDEWGTATGADRQMGDSIDWMITWRFRPVGWLSEENQSAYQLHHSPRRKFQKLFQDFGAGRIPAKEIVCWRLDRFTRRRLEGELWLRMMFEQGLNLHESSRGGPRPLAEKEDGFAREWANAEAESTTKSERIHNARLYLARVGKPLWNVNAIGHTPVYEKRRVSGGFVDKQVGATAHPVEAPILRKAAKQRLAGVSWMEVTRQVNREGLRTRGGLLMTPTHLQSVLLATRMVGLVEYRGKLYPENLIPTVIEPVLEFEDWKRLHKIKDETRRPPGGRSNLAGGGLLRCSTCGSSMVMAGQIFVCSKKAARKEFLLRDNVGGRVARDGRRHVSISAVPAQRFIEELTVAIFDQPDLIGRARPLIGQEECEPMILGLESRRQQLREERKRLINLHVKGDLDEGEYDELRGSIDVSLREIADQIRQAEPPASDPAGWLPEDRTLRDIWEDESLEWKLEWVDRVIDHVVVRPGTLGSRQVEERLEPTFTQACLDVPVELIDQVRAIVRDEREVALGGEPAAVDARMLELHEQGLCYEEVAETMNEQGLIRARGSEWTRSAVRGRLYAIHVRKGRELKANSRRRATRLPLETRELIWQLHLEGMAWTPMAAELTEMGVLNVSGEPFDPGNLAKVVEGHRRDLERAATLQGRPAALTPALRKRLLLLHESGHSLAQLAKHLKEHDVPTPSGGTDWARSTILYAIETARWERAARADTEGTPSSRGSATSALDFEKRCKLVEWHDEGATYSAIARRLDEEGVPTPRRRPKWIPGTVRSIIVATRRELERRRVAEAARADAKPRAA